VVTAAAALVVFTNGPILLLSRSVLDRSGRWEDLAVWPWLAAAAMTGAALFVWELKRWRCDSLVAEFNGDSRQSSAVGELAVVGVVWFTLAALVSTLWSVDASATLWRSCIYAGMAFLAWTMARFGDREISTAITVMAAMSVAASLILIATRPDLGIAASDRWQGVYTNPNSLAPLAGIGALTGLRWSLTLQGWWRFGAVGLVLASITALIGAGSRTAWMAFVAALVVTSLPLIHRWALRRNGRNVAMPLVAAGACLSAAAAAAVVVWAWNEPTFSQRRDIWRLVWDRILERPLAGHGFFTFWNIEELTQHVLLRRGSAHNSLVEVALGLGLLGVVPFMVIVVLAARNAGLALWRKPSPDAWLWAALVAFLLVENLTESFVLWFSYSWVLLMAAALRPVPEPASSLRPSRWWQSRWWPSRWWPSRWPPTRLRSGWVVVAVISLAVLVLWLPDLNLPLVNSDDGRILARFGLQGRNFWDLGALQSSFGAVMQPFFDPEYGVMPGADPPTAAVTYAHHPPLQIFITIASVGLLGDNLAALRVVAFAMGAATVVFMALLLRVRGLNWGPTLLAVTAMVSTGFFYVYARIGVGFSLLLALLAAVAWLRTRPRLGAGALVGVGALAAMAAMQSWIALASVALMIVWLFFGLRQPRSLWPPKGFWPPKGESKALVAVCVGGAVGALITAAWLLNATDFAELTERTAFRFGSDVSTAIEQRQFSFGEFLSRQWQFASHEQMAPLWLRILLAPALAAGLLDRRTRVPVLITLAGAAALTFGLQQGAWVHRLWNFPWLAPVTIGLAALFDAIRRALRGPAARLRLPAAAVAVVVAAGTLVSVATGETRDFYLTDPAEAGELLEQLRESHTPEIFWHTPGISTARWASYYLDAPVFALSEDLLDSVADDDLVMVRIDRAPEYLSKDALNAPLISGDAYLVLKGAALRP